MDWQAYGLTDYPDIIKNPMDLGTIQVRLQENKYADVAQFVADVRLTFKNAMTYNRVGSDIYVIADRLGKQFEKKISQIKKQHTDESKSSDPSAPSAPTGKETSRSDRMKLAQYMEQLTSDELGQIVDIIQTQCPDAIREVCGIHIQCHVLRRDPMLTRLILSQEDDDELEIEVSFLDAKLLQPLLSQCTTFLMRRQSQAK